MRLTPFSFLLLLLLPLLLLAPASHAELRSLLTSTRHLGVQGQPEWDIFENKTPEAESLRLNFSAHRNEVGNTLFIRQEDVKQDWTVLLNGKRLGQLYQLEADLIQTFDIPVGGLIEGDNELEVRTKKPEDILLHQIDLGDNTREGLHTSTLTVTVRDEDSGELIPSRITVVNKAGTLASVFTLSQTNLAVRPGVLYTANGRARFQVLPGDYTLFATRGPEYSVSRLEIHATGEQSLRMSIKRQANTKGWVSSDTHIHTVSFSRHGDALLPERIITLAAENIELPVSTEHDLHSDYQPAIRASGLDKYFTWIPGNEVTTRKGHFNIFPVEKSASPPDNSIEHWPDLLPKIRATPNVSVVILNHPTDIHTGFTPFSSTNLNFATGRNLRGDFDFAFDGMELINSGAMRTDWMEPFRAWFALLNRGYKIVGVGASDSHDISRFIVGQGRTYIQLDDSDVSQINIKQACENLKRGRAVVSLGIFPQLTLQAETNKNSAGPGDLLSTDASKLTFRISADAPLAPGAYIRFTLYANGEPVVDRSAKNPTEARFEFNGEILKPLQDTFYVLIVTMRTDPAPAWGLARPYQPTSRHFELQLMGATNPVWVDADHDGKFSSARDYATSLMSKYKDSPRELLENLRVFDANVAAHCAEFLDRSGQNLRNPEFIRLLIASAPQTVRGFQAYILGEGSEKLKTNFNVAP